MRFLETIPLVPVIAEVSTATNPWSALWTYGPLGIWVGYMIYRDKRESDKQDKRHAENLEQSKAVENAFRTNTTSIIVAMAAAKTIDAGYAELLEKVRQENEATKR